MHGVNLCRKNSAVQSFMQPGKQARIVFEMGFAVEFNERSLNQYCIRDLSDVRRIQGKWRTHIGALPSAAIFKEIA